MPLMYGLIAALSLAWFSDVVWGPGSEVAPCYYPEM